MKSRIILLMTVLLAVVPVRASAAEPVADRLSQFVQNIGTFNRILPQEKVYLHFDNTAYYIGDTLWFAAYVVTATDHRPTTLSRVLHVQLITREGTVVDSRTLKIADDGRCHGQFTLKDDYASGYYEVRAYTLYMLNFGNIQWEYEKEAAAFFFNEDYCRRFYQESGTAFSRVFPVYQRPLTPGNWNEKTIRTRPKVTGTLNDWWEKAPAPTVKFYPEGGNLVEGLESRVAFEIHDAEGRALMLRGRLTDHRGKAVTAIRSDIRGRGDFFISPQKGVSRKLQIQYHNKTYNYELPQALSRGYVMTVRQHAQQRGSSPLLQITVCGSDTLCSDSLGLAVICRGQPCIFETVIPQRQRDGTTVSKIHIDTNLLPEGVQQITLFDAQGRIHAERMIFVSHPERRTVRMASNLRATAYDPMERVAIEFSLTDGGEKLPDSFFSLSVCDQQTREKTYTDESILSHLLLSSDLYGFIQEPEYYFSGGGRKDHELDLLMLTQGWRRYDVRQMSGQERFVYQYRPQQGLSLSGRVYPLGGLSLMKQLRLKKGFSVEAYLEIDTMAVEGSVAASPKGEFAFSVPDITGEGLLFIRARDRRDSSFMDSVAAGSRLLRILSRKQQKRERPQSDFFRYAEPHIYSEYILLREGYQPHVRILSFYETNPYDYEREETLAESMGITLAEKSYGDEAYSLDLHEVGISAKQALRKLDFSTPAIRLDFMDETNLQLDLGIFTGSIGKGEIATNAAMRHGIRGNGGSTDKYKVSHGMAFDFDRTGEASGGDISVLDELLYGLAAARDTKGDAYDGMYYNGDRDEDRSWFMHRNIGELRKRYMTVEGTSMIPDVTRFNYPDSIRNVPYKMVEAVRRLNIFCDKTDRVPMDISEVRDVYTDSYITDFEYSDELMPAYKGRKLHFRGYSKPAEFYSPDYSKMDLKNPPKDYRRTLYWNPDVHTDSQGRARIEFYNNSTARHLVISAEGLTSDGQPVVLKQ